MVESQFRLRFRMLIGKPLTSRETTLSLVFEGRELLIKSQIKDQPLSETVWVVLQANGFSSEEAASNFGERLRTAAEIASLCTRLGANTGQDKPTGWIEENFARSMGLLQAHERVRPNVHGIQILPDDDHTRIPIVQAALSVTADPASFLDAFKELANSPSIKTDAVRSGLRVLNLALMTPHPLAQLVLAFSAIEALGQDEDWTTAQRALIEELAIGVEGAQADPERLEIATALRRGLHRIGLRQGVLRVLARLGQTQFKKEWDRLYGLRSGLFHGIAPLTEPETNQLAQDAVTLCGKIIISLLELEKIKIPSIARTHFGS